MYATYSTRFRQWRFWALLGFAAFDLLTPFFPFSALVLVAFLFFPRVEWWIANLLERAIYGPLPEVLND